MHEGLKFPMDIGRDLPPPRLTMEQYLNFLNFTRELALKKRRAPCGVRSSRRRSGRRKTERQSQNVANRRK